MPKSTFWRSGGRLLRFWGMFFWKRFFIIFKARKNRTKIEKRRPQVEKKAPRMSQKQSLRRFGGGPAECAGPPGERNSFDSTVLWAKHIKKNPLTSPPPATIFCSILGPICHQTYPSWMILDAIWIPAGRQGAPKNNLFSPRSHQKGEKWFPKWDFKNFMRN